MMSEEIGAGHGGGVLGVLRGLRSVVVLGVMCAGVAGCRDINLRACANSCVTGGGRMMKFDANGECVCTPPDCEATR